MIRKKSCYSGTSVCRGDGCFSAEINPFLLTTKAVGEKSTKQISLEVLHGDF